MPTTTETVAEHARRVGTTVTALRLHTLTGAERALLSHLAEAVRPGGTHRAALDALALPREQATPAWTVRTAFSDVAERLIGPRLGTELAEAVERSGPVVALGPRHGVSVDVVDALLHTLSRTEDAHAATDAAFAAADPYSELCTRDLLARGTSAASGGPDDVESIAAALGARAEFDDADNVAALLRTLRRSPRPSATTRTLRQAVDAYTDRVREALGIDADTTPTRADEVLAGRV